MLCCPIQAPSGSRQHQVPACILAHTIAPVGSNRTIPFAGNVIPVLSCSGTVPDSQHYQVHACIIAHKTIPFGSIVISVLSCLGTVPGSQQHQVPPLRAASELASHSAPAAKPDSYTCEHLPPWNHCWQQPSYVWPGPRSIWQQQKVWHT